MRRGAIPRWCVAIAVSVAAFAATWWLTEVALDLSREVALTLGTLASGFALTPMVPWASNAAAPPLGRVPGNRRVVAAATAAVVGAAGVTAVVLASHAGPGTATPPSTTVMASPPPSSGPLTDVVRQRLLETGPAHDAAFLADDALLTLSDGPAEHEIEVVFWRTRGESPRRTAGPRYPRAEGPAVVAVASGGQRAATFVDGDIRVWDLSDRNEPRYAALRDKSVPHTVDVAFTSDGRTMASVGTDGLVLWDSSQVPATKIATLSNADARRVAFSAGRDLMVTGNDDGVVTIWDVRNRYAPKELATRRLAAKKLVTAFAFRGNGDDLAVSGPDKRTELWSLVDATKPRLVSTIRTQESVRSLAFSPDGDALATGDMLGNLTVWDVRQPGNPRVAVTRQEDEDINAVEFSPDGQHLVTAGRTATILWDVVRD